MDPTTGNGSFVPVGTVEEVSELQLPLYNFATCSAQTPNSMGCPWKRFCDTGNVHLRAIVSGHTPPGHAKPLAGPETIAVFRQLTLSEGRAAAVLEIPCYAYYYSGLHQRRQQMGETGEIIKILGVAGDGKKYRFVETVRAHTKRNPDCDDCTAGRCVKTVTRTVERELTPLKRPDQRYAMHALGNEYHQKEVEALENEQTLEAFGIVPELPAETEAGDDSGGAPRTGRRRNRGSDEAGGGGE